MEDLNPPAIIGEQVAGHAAQVRKQLMVLTMDLNQSTFDLADLLTEAAEAHLYTVWGYASIGEYANKELSIKERKAQYLIRITQVCKAVGVSRFNFEPAGISKLREITRLDPQGSFFNPETKAPEALSEHIVRLITNAEQMTGTQITEEVRRLMGQTGGNRPVTKMMSWTEDTYNRVILPAQELARKRLGSAKRDENGNAVEYTDSVVEEVIHAEFLADANQYEPDTEFYIEPDSDTSEPLPIPTEAI
jgi:hypothetical protein